MIVLAICIGFVALFYGQCKLYDYFWKIDKTHYVIVAALQCLLSSELSERFKDDKDIIKAKHDYISVPRLNYLITGMELSVQVVSK